MNRNMKWQLAGQLLHRLVEGYYSYFTAINVSRNSATNTLIPSVLPGQIVSIGQLKSKKGAHIEFDFSLYLEQSRNDDFVKDIIDRVWFTGALLTIGQTLSENDYFDRSPPLELIRHLRNGVAHGNKFHFHKTASLFKYPAHDYGSIFQVTASLEGHPILFDFMEPGDIQHLFLTTSIYLQG